MKKAFDKYYDQRGVIVQIMHDHQRVSGVGKQADLFEQFHKATGDFGELSKQVKCAIIAEAHKITSNDYLRPWKRL